MATYIGNIKVTQKDIIKNWWKLNYFTGGIVPTPTPPVNGNGLLYNWRAIIDNRILAPDGYHFPSQNEWLTLKAELGGDAVAGGKLKEIGFLHWDNPNTGATDEYGFSARGVGFLDTTGNITNVDPGSFVRLKENTFFWSTTKYDSSFIKGMWLDYNTSNFQESYPDILAGCPIRLLKDDSIDPGTFQDRDGNIYDTIKIGNQVWAKQNFIGTLYKYWKISYTLNGIIPSVGYVTMNFFYGVNSHDVIQIDVSESTTMQDVYNQIVSDSVYINFHSLGELTAYIDGDVMELVFDGEIFFSNYPFPIYAPEDNPFNVYYWGGTVINVEGGTEWSSLMPGKSVFCYYNNNPELL